MKTHYKYIYFRKGEDKPKTSVWYCHSKSSNASLGVVQWYSFWRQYSFIPSRDTVFNNTCLDDINDFIGQLAKL